VKRADRILSSVFGSGFTWGAAIFTLSDRSRRACSYSSPRDDGILSSVFGFERFGDRVTRLFRVYGCQPSGKSPCRHQRVLAQAHGVRFVRLVRVLMTPRSMRTSALAIIFLGLAACVSSPSDDATLTLNVGSGALEITYERGPNHTFEMLSATFNGVALDLQVAETGGCTTNDPDPLGNGCSPSVAQFQAAIGSAVGADVTVTDGNDTFHLVAPALFAARAITVQTALDHPLAAGDTVTASNGVAGDQLGGWLAFDLPPDFSCFAVTGQPSAGSLSYHLDLNPKDSDSSCPSMPAGTIVAAQMEVDITPLPASTCDGPANVTCTLDMYEYSLQQYFPVQLRF